eukprot:CAMPEP_0117677104 /NCGR_PEP_ID=MMETSP0804-20121206/16563_1 /TAXON_ID=1074897 /ORGANISM="Tetraselmis astigmatica, Strain CCMP880" /LENGTH=68 /DNA_ID=CAMNT_0005486357 /DNA_START=549 /DNA_END=755 /DNA_ORIENTATION=-
MAPPHASPATEASGSVSSGNSAKTDVGELTRTLDVRPRFVLRGEWKLAGLWLTLHRGDSSSSSEESNI